MKIVLKSSFSLFELLIVILIISIIYGIFVEKIAQKRHFIQSQGLQEIPLLLKPLDFNESAKIICINDCHQCFIQRDSKKVKEIEIFAKEVNVYDFNIHGVLNKISFTPIFDQNGNPQEVCFEYELKKNGSGSSYIVEYKKRFYTFFAYMQPVKVFASLTKASEAFDTSKWIPTQTDEYNF